MLSFDFLNVKIGRNEWWRYLFTLILVSTVGLLISVFVGLWIESFIHLTLPGNINGVLAKDLTIMVTVWILFLFILVLKIHKRSPKTLITAKKHSMA